MNEGIKVGYARVSSQSQSLDNQRDRLAQFGCQRVFEEKYSGSTADNRKSLQDALQFVRQGDTLIVTKLDRLARSATDLGNIANMLQKKSVDLVVLDQHIDTTTPSGKLMFTMIGAFAEFERDLIRARCQEGIQRAKEKGVKFGRQPKLTQDQLVQLKADFEEGTIGKSSLALKYGISRSSVYRLLS